MTGARDQLTGVLRVNESHVFVTLVGEIDIATVPLFSGWMDEAIAAGVPRVVVDLADVDVLGAAGLTILVIAAQRLRIVGAHLVVRGASAWVYRLFEVTGLTESLGVERPAAVSDLVRALTGGASIPLAREVLDAALRLVVTMANAVVTGADGVSITLTRNGKFGTVAASNDVVLEMDHDQYDTGEGPCLDAATHGERFLIESLESELRWPAFVLRAKARGIETILSTPLVAAAKPIGALNVYSRTAGAFAAHEYQWADQFAAEAAVLVSKTQIGTSADALNGQIQDALLSREVIALARGVIVHRDGVSPAEAHILLRDISRRTSQPLREVCQDLVTSYSSVDSTRAPSDGGVHGPSTR